MKTKLNILNNRSLSLLGCVFILLMLFSIAFAGNVIINAPVGSVNATYFYQDGNLVIDSSSPALQETADYVIWKDGSTIKAKNSTGHLAFSGSDAATVINAVLTDCDSTNAHIHINTGFYRLTDSITIAQHSDNSLTITGSGSGTILYLDNNINKSIITQDNLASSSYNIVIEHLRLDGNKENNSNNYGINLVVKKLVVDQVQVHNCRVGINLSGYMNKISECFIQSNGHIGVIMSYDSEISDSYFVDNGEVTTDTYSSAIYGNSVTDVRIKNNHLWGNERNVLFHWSNSILIQGNVMESGNKGQISATGYVRRWVIQDNKLEAGLNKSYPAISILASGGYVCKDNLITNNVIDGIYSYCIYEGANSDNNSIISNDVGECTAATKQIYITGDNTLQYSHSNFGATDQKVTKLINSNGDGLVGYWAFDESSGTVAYDSSPYKNDGVFSGSPSFTTHGKFGSGISATGASGCHCIVISNNPDLNITTNITLAAWVKQDSSQSWRGIIKKYAFTNEHRSYALALETLTPSFVLSSTGNVSVTATSSSNVVIGEWTHILGTWNGSTMELYVNGILKGTHAFSGPIFTSSDDIKIGSKNDDSYSFDGVIDEAKIWNASLNIKEVRAEYMLGLSSHAPTGHLIPKTGGLLTGTINTDKYLNVTSSGYGACSSSYEGFIVYNATSNHFYGCNSTNWILLS